MNTEYSTPPRKMILSVWEIKVLLASRLQSAAADTPWPDPRPVLVSVTKIITPARFWEMRPTCTVPGLKSAPVWIQLCAKECMEYVQKLLRSVGSLQVVKINTMSPARRLDLTTSAVTTPA